MAIVFPHDFQDGVGETASGVQVMQNLRVLQAALEKAEATIVALQVAGAGATGPGSWTEAGASLKAPTVLSASRPGLVAFRLEGNGAPISGQIKVGGKIVGSYNTSATVISLGEFYVPKGQTWEINHEGGVLNGATISSLLL